MFKIVYIFRKLLHLTICIRSCIYSQKDRYNSWIINTYYYLKNNTNFKICKQLK